MASPSSPLARVVVFGGTHGNEMTGVGLVRHWAAGRGHGEVERPGLEVLTLLANPLAADRTVRYIDHDLNRCFLPSDLLSSRAGYEFDRAREIVASLGGPEKLAQSVLIDLHTTTSNMGVTVILTTVNEFNLALAAHLSRAMPFLKVITNHLERNSSPFVNGLSPYGFCVEVGPVAQGTLDPAVVAQTRNVVTSVVDFCSAWATPEGALAIPGESVTQGVRHDEAALDVFEYAETLDYPRYENGAIAAMIHPERFGRDFIPIEKGSPLFVDWGGQVSVFEGEGIYWPIFVGESAYVEKQTAMVLTRRRRLWAAAPRAGGQ